MNAEELTKISEANAKRIAILKAKAKAKKEKEEKLAREAERITFEKHVKSEKERILSCLESAAKQGRKSYSESFFKRWPLVERLQKELTKLGFTVTETSRYIEEDPPCLSDGYGGREGGWEYNLNISWGKEKS